MSYFTYDQAMEEAARCLLCYEAPCSEACPANTDPAKFIRSIRFNNLKGAAETIRTKNILGGICARVCPYDQLCQKDCVRAELDQSIQIGKLQEFVCDYEKANELEILRTPELKKEKVAIIGSGPAGLAAAGELALSGYQVKVFEKREKVGGWLNYGIPSTKLPPEIVETEIDYIRDLGVEFETNCEVGQDITLADLRAGGYKTFLMALGQPEAKKLELEGNQLAGVKDAVSFLIKAKTQAEKLDVKAKKVVIVGGGNVAVDCALTAKKYGAADVSMVCLENLATMPAAEKELIEAQKHNINIYAGFKPEAIAGEQQVEKFSAFGVENNSKLELEAEQVILAIGQTNVKIKEIEDLKLDQAGFIETNSNFKTNYEDIFAAGDIINTEESVVNAIAEGKEAAKNMMDYLNNKKEKVKVSL
ncbi:FAD-dependent oxidoreductase [Halanaerobium praevalens]|uniref:FAD-dependent pyridine nucleotide-disulfide oxidoreductase n=1 Tax=Halanaerobium praevalens (strain ATCC 33744 / DSM 2228 / GSL) TaxID=572479 RepID=E3DNW5_HALPG|nr:FAD-dependent oxidoreductase [Halanaerobium praevalens]ADO76589.1 FAD-dependent pyridine nucleotide-disulfide oxidoreductase [Halanaerobium praevalens DSM 2228]